MSPKTIYISGPMSGRDNFNFDAFDNAAKIIRDRGDIAVNPATRGKEWVAKNGNREMTEAEYNRILLECLDDVRRCDSIFLLKGWEASKGARRELQVALINKKDVEVEQ